MTSGGDIILGENYYFFWGEHLSPFITQKYVTCFLPWPILRRIKQVVNISHSETTVATSRVSFYLFILAYAFVVTPREVKNMKTNHSMLDQCF